MLSSAHKTKSLTVKKTLMLLAVVATICACKKDNPDPAPNPAGSEDTGDTIFIGAYDDQTSLNGSLAFYIRNAQTGKITAKPLNIEYNSYIGYNSHYDPESHKYISFGDGIYQGEFNVSTGVYTTGTLSSDLYSPIGYHNKWYFVGNGSNYGNSIKAQLVQ